MVIAWAMSSYVRAYTGLTFFRIFNVNFFYQGALSIYCIYIYIYIHINNVFSDINAIDANKNNFNTF